MSLKKLPGFIQIEKMTIFTILSMGFCGILDSVIHGILDSVPKRCW